MMTSKDLTVYPIYRSTEGKWKYMCLLEAEAQSITLPHSIGKVSHAQALGCRG